MFPETIELYARQRNLSPQDAAQTFMQIVVLRHLSVPGVRLIGGTALVLGHNNPRFSEDVDLTQVAHPDLLRPGLAKAATELKNWFGSSVMLLPPKGNGRTWRMTCLLGRASAVRLNVDCQEYPAYTVHPIVLQFPSLSPFSFDAIELDEIMADKVIALAYRRYLGGRDLFDLWFHWLRLDDWSLRLPMIRQFIDRKLKDRSFSTAELHRLLQNRLSPKVAMERARTEWQRYLPADFQKKGIQEEMLKACGKLPEFFHDAN